MKRFWFTQLYQGEFTQLTVFVRVSLPSYISPPGALYPLKLKGVGIYLKFKIVAALAKPNIYLKFKIVAKNGIRQCNIKCFKI